MICCSLEGISPQNKLVAFVMLLLLEGSAWQGPWNSVSALRGSVRVKPGFVQLLVSQLIFCPPLFGISFWGNFLCVFFISSLKIKKSRFYQKLHQSSAACGSLEKQGPCEDGTIHSRGRIPCGRPHGVRWEVLAPNNGKVEAIAQPDLDELWQVVTLWKAASRRKWWLLLGGSSHES